MCQQQSKGTTLERPYRTTSFTAAPVSAPMALSAAWRAAGPLVTPEATIRYVHTCNRRRVSRGHKPRFAQPTHVAAELVEQLQVGGVDGQAIKGRFADQLRRRRDNGCGASASDA